MKAIGWSGLDPRPRPIRRERRTAPAANPIKKNFIFPNAVIDLCLSLRLSEVLGDSVKRFFVKGKYGSHRIFLLTLPDATRDVHRTNAVFCSEKLSILT